MTAKFDNIGGLKPRAAVKSAGVVVGRVESISFDDKSYQARVVLQLQKRFAFPKDTSAKILTSGLLGEQYLGLEPGGDVKNLAAGDTITQTQSAVVLENLISQFLFNKAAEAGSTAAAPAAAPAARRNETRRHDARQAQRRRLPWRGAARARQRLRHRAACRARAIGSTRGRTGTARCSPSTRGSTCAC